MSLINWQLNYTVGIEKIDNEHKMLIQTINDLFEAMTVGKGREIIGNVLQNLSDYAQNHFQTEEAYMLEIKFPQLIEHKREHSSFNNKLKEFRQKFDEKNLLLTGEVIDFLKNWFVNHICSSDKKYADFVKFNF